MFENYRNFINKYLYDQYVASKFKNRVKFVFENYRYLGIRKSTRYLLRYSPSIRTSVMGAWMVEGFRQGLEGGRKIEERY